MSPEGISVCPIADKRPSLCVRRLGVCPSHPVHSGTCPPLYYTVVSTLASRTLTCWSSSLASGVHGDQDVGLQDHLGGAGRAVRRALGHLLRLPRLLHVLVLHALHQVRGRKKHLPYSHQNLQLRFFAPRMWSHFSVLLSCA